MSKNNRRGNAPAVVLEKPVADPAPAPDPAPEAAPAPADSAPADPADSAPADPAVALRDWRNALLFRVMNPEEEKDSLYAAIAAYNSKVGGKPILPDGNLQVAVRRLGSWGNPAHELRRARATTGSTEPVGHVAYDDAITEAQRWLRVAASELSKLAEDGKEPAAATPAAITIGAHVVPSPKGITWGLPSEGGLVIYVDRDSVHVDGMPYPNPRSGWRLG